MSFYHSLVTANSLHIFDQYSNIFHSLSFPTSGNNIMLKLIITLSCLLIASPRSGYANEQDEESLPLSNICSGNEKLAKIHFYVQDIVGGPNATVYEVARASITSDSPTRFGQVLVVDDLVTAEPDPNSEKLGRSQGTVTFSDLNTTAAAMNFNIVFTAGKYNGSTISIVGRNQIEDEVREFSVVGGTGMFRFSRGYLISSFYSYHVDAEITYAVIEQTIYATYTSLYERHTKSDKRRR